MRACERPSVPILTFVFSLLYFISTVFRHHNAKREFFPVGCQKWRSLSTAKGIDRWNGLFSLYVRKEYFPHWTLCHVPKCFTTKLTDLHKNILLFFNEFSTPFLLSLNISWGTNTLFVSLPDLSRFIQIWMAKIGTIFSGKDSAFLANFCKFYAALTRIPIGFDEYFFITFWIFNYELIFLIM